MFTLFGDDRSGNCMKVAWTAHYLGMNFKWRPVDVISGETRTAELLELNLQGQVPFVEFGVESGETRKLAQSNAIIRFLARDSALLPRDPFAQALVDQWLFWEQYSHEPYIAVSRFQMRFLGKSAAQRDAWRVERGEQALDLMNSHLGDQDWFAGDALTIADIALFAYTHVAHEGGFDLRSRVQLSEWIERCASELKTEINPVR